MLSCLYAGNPNSKRWSFMPHKSKTCWKHSFRKLFLSGHFCDHQQQKLGMFWYFHFWRERSLKFICLFPCLKINGIYFLKCACPQCFNVFWNSLPTADLMHSASCSTQHSFPLLVWSGACVSPKIRVLAL